MKTSLSKLTVGVMAASLSAGALAQTDYNEPTRGFFLERAATAPNQQASVDLGTGGSQDFGGGVRLGLPSAELILNHGQFTPGIPDVDEDVGPGDPEPDLSDRMTQNEAILKFGLPSIALDGGNAIDMSVYGGLAHYDPDTGDSVTNITGGAAMTMDLEGFVLNFNPQMVFDDGAQGDADDVYIDLGFGGHYYLPETQVGTFAPGAEFNLTTRDDAFGESVDPQFMLGVRWLYNENVTLDLAMVNNNPSARRGQSSDADTEISIPGYLRLNVAF